jgi:hypothetical protein
MNTRLRSAGTIDEARSPAPPEAGPDAAPDVAPDAADRPARPARPPARPMSPRLIALFGLALGISILVAYTLDRKIFTDVFWQLAAGQWMLAHHSVIGLDPFSYTETHRRWINDEWGSEVILASLYKVFGAAAFNIIAIVTGSLSLVCTMLYARTLGARGGRLAAIAILLALGIAGFVTQDRGLSFSLIWLPLELLVLAKARTNPRLLWWLPPLFLLWANTHGSILVGLMVLGVELAWSVAPERLAARVGGTGRSTHPRQLFVVAVVGTLASFVTPYGPHLVFYDISVGTNSQIGQYISEWNSPNFHSVVELLTFGLIVAVFVFAVRSRRMPVLESTLVVLFFLGALHSARISIYLYVAAAGLAASLPLRRVWAPRTRRIVGALGIGLMLALAAYPSVPAGTVTADTPVQAFTFLESHPGRIFTQYTWGDYAIVRHRATFADGRTDLFIGPVLTEFFDVSDVKVNPDPIFARYHVDYVVWPRATPLAEYLSHDARWVVVDHTGPALVFARTSVWGNQPRH